ncbi:MAG: response regulator [Bdellovibrionales bacterium]|nr:response regulator [Bdellovibrionales bacterium]
MNKYVLIVDDNPSDLMISSAQMEKNGFVALTAQNGYQALDVIENNNFCLFVIDLQMPKMGGIELIKRLKRIDNFKNIPVLVTSARKESTDVILAIQAGAKDYLVKPIDSMIFEEKLQKLIGDRYEWKEYPIPIEENARLCYIKTPSTIVSISEVSMTILHNQQLNVDAHFEFEIKLFDNNISISTKVDKCIKNKDGYLVKLSLVGLTEEIRKKIRLYCRQIWTKEQVL